jgi:hypothetical protein
MVRPVEARYDNGIIVIVCSNGQKVKFHPHSNPVLRDGTPDQLGNIECSPYGLHWPDLNEDLSLAGILQNRLGERGGARSGAGRKPSGRAQYVTRLPPDLISWVKEEAQRENLAECRVIELALLNAKDSGGADFRRLLQKK